jgi:hypothetical protein
MLTRQGYTGLLCDLAIRPQNNVCCDAQISGLLQASLGSGTHIMPGWQVITVQLPGVPRADWRNSMCMQSPKALFDSKTRFSEGQRVTALLPCTHSPPRFVLPLINAGPTRTGADYKLLPSYNIDHQKTIITLQDAKPDEQALQQWPSGLLADSLARSHILCCPFKHRPANYLQYSCLLNQF